MNASGRVIPFLQKKGIRAENLIVVHDELEKPFGSLALKMGGSARGHNGLRSIIGLAGPDFLRLRFGIGRPKRQEEVSDYVLQRFEINQKDLMECVEEAVILIEDLFIKKET
jgi:PTH1 family peptidyl-tRNA hydrolase